MMTQRYAENQRPAVTPAPVSVQRTSCACGKSMGPSGECADCQRRRLGQSTRLILGQPHDRHEKEAEHLADRIMGSAPPSPIAAPSASRGGLVQRQPEEEEEEELIQRSATAANRTPMVDGHVASSIEAERSRGGRPIPNDLRHFFEPRFGRSFDSVRIHTSEPAARSASALQARAFTVGSDIFFGANQYRPASQDGRRLMAHELAHTLQQRPAPGMGVVRRDFARQPRRTANPVTPLTPAELADAVAFNGTRLSDPYMFGQVRDVLGVSPSPMISDEDLAAAIGRFQARWRLTQDGKLGHRTTFRLFQEFVAEGLNRDAVLLLIESYNLRVDRALQDIRFTRRAAFCNAQFAAVSGGRHCGGGGVIMTVCQTDLRPRTFADYNQFIRVINHELVHVPQCARGTGNADVDEFEAFHSEVCGRGAGGRMPILNNAQRLSAAQSAITHFNRIPAALRTVRRTNMRNQLQAVVTARGAGAC